MFNKEMYHSIKPASIESIAKIKADLIECEDEYLFSTLKFARPYVVVYLDQLFRKYSVLNNILFLPKERKIHKYLHQVGFEFLRGHCPEIPDFNEECIIKLKFFNGSEEEVEEQALEWINKDILKFISSIDKMLKRKIVNNIWEIIQNSLLHSENLNGISACGQLYPKKKYFELAFYDFGIGIPGKIKKHFISKLCLNDCECIKWAMDKGNSTKNVPNAGMGLYFLREFIKMNGGYFQLISNSGFLGHIHSSYEDMVRLHNLSDGTLVNIRINY